MLKINLLGKIKIEYNNDNIEPLLSRKIVALIYLMTANKGKYISRSQVMSYLWPESSEDAARYNLRYNLWHLKNILPTTENGDSLIIADKDACTLNEQYPLSCDLITIREFSTQNASISDLNNVKDLFTGNIMEGWYLKNCNEFNEMILFDRMLCDNKQIEIFKALALKYEAEKKFNKSLDVLKELAVLEPDDESLALHIMKTYVRSGNRAAAINYYRTFETSLLNNLNITPNEEITSFYRSLQDNKQSKTLKSNNTSRSCTAKDCIEINVNSIEGIEYFLIASIVSKLVNNISAEVLLQLNYEYIYDLSFIQKEILIKYRNSNVQKNIQSFQPIIMSEDLTPVRVINAFCQLIELTTKLYKVRITVLNSKTSDEISLKTLEYLKTLRYDNLAIKLI